MKPFTSTEIAFGGLSLKAAPGDACVLVEIAGNADMAAIRTFERFIGELHAAVVVSQEPRVVVDVRELYFMNSSCLKVLVVWITNVLGLAEKARYSICFRPSASLSWQRRSFGALKRVAPELVHFSD